MADDSELPGHVRRAIEERQLRDKQRPPTPFRPPLIAGVLVAVVALVFAASWFRSERASFRTYERGEGPFTVLLFHGYGASGDDLVPLAERLIECLEAEGKHARFIMVEAPHSRGLGRTWYRNDEERDATLDGLSSLIDDLEAEGTAEDHLIIGGFSMGATVAYELGQRRSHLGGTILLSGRLQVPRRSEPLSLPPAFIAHGRGDSVVDFSNSARLSESLQERGEQVTFFPFAGDHTIPPSAIDALAQWLTARF